jgi:hypothetical protein
MSSLKKEELQNELSFHMERKESIERLLDKLSDILNGHSEELNQIYDEIGRIENLIEQFE